MNTPLFILRKTLRETRDHEVMSFNRTEWKQFVLDVSKNIDNIIVSSDTNMHGQPLTHVYYEKDVLQKMHLLENAFDSDLFLDCFLVQMGNVLYGLHYHDEFNIIGEKFVFDDLKGSFLTNIVDSDFGLTEDDGFLESIPAFATPLVNDIIDLLPTGAEKFLNTDRSGRIYCIRSFINTYIKSRWETSSHQPQWTIRLPTWNAVIVSPSWGGRGQWHIVTVDGESTYNPVAKSVADELSELETWINIAVNTKHFISNNH